MEGYGKESMGNGILNLDLDLDLGMEGIGIG